jgi:hypothetical protein
MANLKNKQPQKKRRQPAAKKRGPVTPVNPTSMEVQRNLKKQTLARGPKSLSFSPYAECRLNPFKGGAAMYPGGGSTPVVVLDHRMFADIALTAGASYHLRIIPCAPYGAIMHLESTTASAIVTNNKGSTTYGPDVAFGADTNLGWAPVATMVEWNTGSYPGVATTSLYDATQARVTAGGFRLTYTGTTNNCRGLISMTNGSLNVTTRETVPINVGVINEIGGTAYTVAANAAESLQVDGEVIANPCAPTTRVVRMDRGASGRLTQVSETLPFRPIAQSGAVMVTDRYTTGFLRSGTGQRTSVAFYDESWAPLDIFLSGIDSNITMRLDVALCVEYLIGPSSAVSRFARPPPPVNLPLINKLTTVAREIPSFGDLSTLENAVKDAAPYLKVGMGIAGKIAAMML